MNATIAVPGVRVGCTYREGFGHTGTVLALNDPDAWEDSLAFHRKRPPLSEVTAHVVACIRRDPRSFENSVPVRWSFGRVYWEHLHALYPLRSTT